MEEARNPTPSIAELRPGDDVTVICQHFNVLGRLIVDEGPRAQQSQMIVARPPGGTAGDYGTFALLGTLTVRRMMVMTNQVDATLAEVPPGSRTRCDCKLEPMPHKRAPGKKKK